MSGSDKNVYIWLKETHSRSGAVLTTSGGIKTSYYFTVMAIFDVH